MEKKNILKLYPTDFAYIQDWQDTCDVLNISYDAKGIQIEFINAEEIENDN